MGTRRSWYPRDVQEGFAGRLHWTILQHDPIPVTTDKWIAAARREIQRRRLVLASLGPRKEHPMAIRDRLKEALRRPPQRLPQRDPDAIDVDAAILGDGSRNGTRERFWGISEAERRKRSAEGRCFRCGRQGHLKRDCPNRVKGEKKEENVRAPTMELQEENVRKLQRREKEATHQIPLLTTTPPSLGTSRPYRRRSETKC